MPDTTMPPVGATLSVVKESPLHGVCVLRHTQEGEARWGFLVDSVDPRGPIPIESNFTDHAALSLAWRSEQARQEAETRAGELLVQQGTLERDNIALRQRLARFEALAREAYDVAVLGVADVNEHRQRAMRIVEGLAGLSHSKDIAALAQEAK